MNYMNSAQLPGQDAFSDIAMNFNHDDLKNSSERGPSMLGKNLNFSCEERVRSQPASSGGNLPNYLSFSESIKFPTAHRSRRIQPCDGTPFNLLSDVNDTSKTPSVVQFDFATPAFKTGIGSYSKAKQREHTNSSRQSQSVLSLLQNPNFGSSSAKVLRTNYVKKISTNFERPMEVQPAIFANNVSTTSSLKRPTNINRLSSEDEFFSTPAGQHAKRVPKSVSLRTTSSSVPTIAEPSNQSTVLALIEGRGRAKGEVGMAVMDLERPNLTLCQISDSQTYVNTVRKINILHPAEIIIPFNSLPVCENVNMNSNLYNLLRERFPTIRLTTVQRKYFSDATGWQVVQNLCLDEHSSVLPVIQKKSYALGAAASLLKYAEFHQNLIFSPKSLRVDYQSGDKVMFIDLRTAENLELTVCHEVETNMPFNTFFGVLNRCCTIGGQRRLRSMILQPSTDSSEIESRLQCVQELLENETLFQSTKTILPKLWDVERLLSLCGPIADLKNTDMAAELQINYLVSLKTSLEVIPALDGALSGTNSNFFINFRTSLRDSNYRIMLERIYRVLNEDAHLGPQYDVNLFQRCFAIKTGINSFLDIARIAYTELVQDFNEIVEQLIQQYHLPLEVKILRNKGPVIRLKATKLKKDLPKVFIQVHKTKHMITMTTKDLLFLKERMNHFIQEIQLLSSSIIFEVLRDIREYIGSLYVFCENIAELDLVVSFAHVSKHMGYVRPQFTEDRMMVQSSVHPILNQTSTCRPMPNDIIANIHENVCLITGPNMGGKSIYIRQVALLQIMAQIGCFVPADVAVFRLTDSIFSRIGFEDNIECNASSFVVEIKEMHYILQHVTPRSIIIIDELCRGTSTEEGTALAWAITEELLATSAFTFFATHFFYLTKLQDLYCNVQNYHFEAVEANPATDLLPFLSYTHRLIPGVLRLENYGLKLARSTAIPEKILLFAQEIVRTLTLTWKACSVANEIVTPEKRVDTIIIQLLSFMDNETFSVNIVDELIEYVNEMRLICATKSNVPAVHQKQKMSHSIVDEDADVSLADLNGSSRESNNGVILQRGKLIAEFLRSNSPADGSGRANCGVGNESDERDNNDDANTPSKECHLEMRVNGVENGYVKTPANRFNGSSSSTGHRSDCISSSARAFDARLLSTRGPQRQDCFTA